MIIEGYGEIEGKGYEGLQKVTGIIEKGKGDEGLQKVTEIIEEGKGDEGLQKVWG